MSESQACCAHSRVVSKHEDFPDGHRSEYWECDYGCGMRFYPAQTDQAGIRLRDWFAGMALQGLLVNAPNGASDRLCCEEAFKFADSMLAERSK